jgi:hypothetical protein
MRRYTAAQARQNLARLLDTAENGQSVVIERRGVRFVLRADRMKRRSRIRRRPIIEILDPAVARGQWTWDWGPGGLRFVARGRRR